MTAGRIKCALVIKADMSRVAEITAVMEDIGKEFERIDALFFNHGVAHPVAFEEVTEENFDATMTTNVKGAFFAIQKALPLLSRDSAIVLNASINAHRGSSSGVVYGASKAAVVNLAKTLSADLAVCGIRLNVVSPGPIATPIFDRMGYPEDQTRQIKEHIAGLVPMKRFGHPDEIAAAVLYLCFGDAAFVVGSELIVDSGMMRAAG